MDTTLTFNCPHCAFQYLDDFELLSADIQHEFNCENCRHAFTLCLFECGRCGGETTHIAMGHGHVAPEARPACGSCGRAIELDEGDDDDY